MFAGTEFGVYASFDDGDHWQSLQLNLPVTSVRDLAVHDNDLIVATHGRSFWVLDDISSLRQIGEKMATSDAWLYQPGRAIRTTNDSFSGTPLPIEEPQAKNPPHGVSIDYYLAKDASGAVELEITDANGTVVRQFSSREKGAASPKNLAIAEHWLTEAAPLKKTAGMHRFVWDLRYGRSGEQTTADDADTGLQTWIGPLVLPGTYQIKLTVNGKSAAPQRVQIAIDTRSEAPTPALREQFRWAQGAFDDMVKARVAASEIRGLQAQLDKVKEHTGASAPLLDSVARAEKQAGQIQTGAPSGRPEDRDSSLTAVARKLSIALNALEGADRVPPAQVIALCKESRQTLKARLTEWTALKQKVVPQLNEQLRRSGIDPLQIVRVEEEAQAGVSQ